MEPERRALVERLLQQAVELGTEQRRSFLEDACAGDEELRITVERLLNLLPNGTDDLREAVAEATTRLLESTDPEPQGRIGPYRIVQRLGSGGMGDVYQAEQEEPIRRLVALKVIKPGMDSREVIGRFESERQALALMNHSNIAKVHDAGTTSEGRPYFVMEHVAGESLTSYCDRNQLTIHERIELFLQICDGVQHAHQKGIIHRDLKPSNILVTVENDRPVPKLIDFGIAKATSQPLTEQPVHTLLGTGIGTPEYMSPEQVHATGQDVDTRTDVYALGVILYELLSGVLPFDSAALRQDGYDGLRRMICEQDPPTPSGRASALGEASDQAARARGIDRGALCRALSGEPDWITMKAMEKDRARRYASANELAADLRRYLAHEPVLAGPPSPAYRARKFVRRHRAGVSMGSAIGVALVLGVIATGVGMVRAQQAERAAVTEARTAREVVDFLVSLFRESDPNLARGEMVTAREVLDRGTRQVHATLSDEPLIRARLLHTIGLVYQELGLLDDAEPPLDESLTIRRQELGDDHPDTLTSMSDLAFLYERQLRHEEAEPLQREALEGRQKVLGDEHPDTLLSLERMAPLYEEAGRHDEEESALTRALETRRRVQGDDHPDTIQTMEALAWFYANHGGGNDARRLAREALSRSTRVMGADHPDTLRATMNLAAMVESEVESEELYQRALEGRREILGDDHPATLNNAYQLAVTYGKTGRHEQAVSLLGPVVERSRRVWGEEHRWTTLYENGLAMALNMSGRRKRAEAIEVDLLERSRRTLGPEHWLTVAWVTNLAAIYRSQGRLDEAAALLQEILDRSKRNDGEDSGRATALTVQIGRLREQQGRVAEAEAMYRKAIELRKGTSANPRAYSGFQVLLAGLCRDQGRFVEAEDLLREVESFGRSLEGGVRDNFLGRGEGNGRDLLWDLSLVRRAQGDPFEAEELLRESMALKAKIYGEDTPAYRYFQARYETLHGDRQAAMEHLQAAMDGGFGLSPILLDPALAPLRTDVQLQTILAEELRRREAEE